MLCKFPTINNLTDSLQRDVASARHRLKQLLGEIALFPSGNYLETEISGNYADLLALGNPKVKLNLVAGAGFEPTTFGL
jgi:hypothetical protein